MKIWRSPGTLPMVAATAVIAVTCVLGNWQLQRGHEKTARAQRLATLAAQGPVDLNAGDIPTNALSDRTVRARGRFDRAHTVLLDNRPHGSDGRAGFLVVTPLRLESGANVLVLRGWLPRDAQDRTRIAPFDTPAGDVTLNGTALATLPRVYGLGASADAEAGRQIRQNVDLGEYAREIGMPLLPLVIEQTTDTRDGLAREWTSPGFGADRHYGYAFQWFAIAALTLALVIVLGVRRARAPQAA